MGEEICCKIEFFINKFVMSRSLRPKLIDLDFLMEEPSNNFICNSESELPCLVTEFSTKLFGRDKTQDMVEINIVKGEKSILKIDEKKDGSKNKKLFYHLFDENLEAASYHVK
jgi:hypothetical protein